MKYACVLRGNHDGRDRLMMAWRRAEGYPGKGLFRKPRSRRVALVDRERCRGCGDCVSVCISRAMAVGRDGKAEARRNCIGCGACSSVCPAGAVSISERD